MDAQERARLDAAYRRTTYAAGLSLRLRVGEPHPFLDDMLSFRGLEEWAYLTAWNPGSKPLPEEENRRRQDALRARLKGRYPTVEGAAHSDDGSWAPEESLLVLGIPRDEALSLAKEFEQVALLAGRRGGRAELVFVG